MSFPSLCSVFSYSLSFCRHDSFILVLDHFGKESMHILSDLQTYPESLFLFMKTIMDSNVTLRVERNYSERGKYVDRVSDLASLLQQNPFSIDDKIVEQYIEVGATFYFFHFLIILIISVLPMQLMCQYEPRSVLHFLKTFDNYRLEHCLRVCQEHGVNDAAAYLLERAGDVGGALEFLMNGLEEKIAILANSVEAICTTSSHNPRDIDLINVCLNMDEVFLFNISRLNKLLALSLFFHCSFCRLLLCVIFCTWLLSCANGIQSVWIIENLSHSGSVFLTCKSLSLNIFFYFYCEFLN